MPLSGPFLPRGCRYPGRSAGGDAAISACGFRKFWPQVFRKFWHQAEAPPVLERPFAGGGWRATPQQGEEDVGDAQTS